jgi:hypothetical protein
MWLADNQHSIADVDQTSQDSQTRVQIIGRDVMGRWEHDLPIEFFINLINIILPYLFKWPKTCGGPSEPNSHFFSEAIPAIMRTACAAVN